MGIDIYAEWVGQITPEPGQIGYLREAYHGGPYATRVLVPEAFEADDGIAIPAATLRERLPGAIVACLTRQATIYEDDDAAKPESR